MAAVWDPEGRPSSGSARPGGRVTRPASVKEIEIADPRRALEYVGRLHGLDQQHGAGSRRAEVTLEDREPGVILILPDNGRGDGPTPLPSLTPKLPNMIEKNRTHEDG